MERNPTKINRLFDRILANNHPMIYNPPVFKVFKLFENKPQPQISFYSPPKHLLLINTQTWNMISSSLLLLNLKPVHTSCWLAWQRLASVGTFTHNQPTPLKTDWAQLATSFVQHNALDRRLFSRASPWHSQLSWKDPDMYIYIYMFPLLKIKHI